MRDLTFPSRLPGWSLLVGAALAALVGTHVSMTAFAHRALEHPGTWIWHLANGDGWRVGNILLRCAPTALAADASLITLPDRRRCRQWWQAFSGWSDGPGGSFVAGTILLTGIGGAAAYLVACSRLVPQGHVRRRTTTYATREDLRPFLRPRGTSLQAMVDGGALPLGQTVPEERYPRRDVWLPLSYRQQHIWILGVTGVGKTSAIIKRWLATDAVLDGKHALPVMSTVAVDVKDPDLWEFAAPVAMRYDRRVLRWSPMCPNSTGHNFLDYVYTVGDALDMAETILSNDTEYNRKDPYWRQTELNMLATTIQLVCEEPPDRLVGTFLQDKMRNILGVSPPPRSLAFILGLSHLHPSEFMAYIEHVDNGRAIWRDRFSKVFQARDEKTVGAWQGLQNVLVIFRDPDVIAATSRSDFPLSAVARQPTTMIIGLPRKPGSRRRVLTALFLRQLLQEFYDVVRDRVPQQLPVPVTFLLDELGVLGLIPTFQDFVATYRDMGVSFVIATQDRKQLVDIYGETKADTLIANLHTRIVMGRDLRPEQADEICRALGETLVPEPGVQYEHRGALSVVRRGTRVGYQTRHLLESNELRAMPEFRAVVVLPGDIKTLVDLSPVHTDPAYCSEGRRISAIEALRHDIRMDRVLGRLPPSTPGLRTQTRPVILAPDEPTGRLPPQPPPAPEASGVSNPFKLQDFAQEPMRVSPPAGRATARPPKSPQIPMAEVPQTPIVEESSPTGQQLPPIPSVLSTTSTTTSRDSPAPDSTLRAFMEAVLSGTLRDERLAPGSPFGWVYEERLNEFLVPWGFLRDWGFKTTRRFTDLEATWTRDGLVRGRGSVIVNGRPVTCLLFAEAAALQLPEQLRRLLGNSFVPVPASEVRPSKTRVLVREKADAGVGTRTAPGTVSPPPPPHLLEFLHALEQASGHFIGHPARDEQLPVHGRWQAEGKDGSSVLLVERHAAERMLETLGVIERERVLALWKQAGILYLGGQIRKGFFTRRTHKEGNEFLALRWNRILSFFPPHVHGQHSSRRLHGDGTGFGYSVDNGTYRP